jgi:hypothetical protein
MVSTEKSSVNLNSDGVILDMTVDQNGMIVGVRFEMPGLQVVDLVQRWGPPDEVMRDQSYYGLH